MEVLHKLAIHEAYNSHKYGEVQVYEWDPIFITPLYIYFPEDKPAKKVTFKMKAGHAASNYEDNDILAILMKTSDSLYSFAILLKKCLSFLFSKEVLEAFTLPLYLI